MTSVFLNKNESILKEAELIGYIGVSYKTQSGFAGLGGGGLFVGGVSTKQTKVENSITDMKLSHAYLTNQRLVFCGSQRSLWSRKETKIKNPISEILLNNIVGMTPTTKLFDPAISLAVRKENQIDNIVLVFTGESSKEADRLGKKDNLVFLFTGISKRETERNEWIEAIQKMKSEK